MACVVSSYIAVTCYVEQDSGDETPGVIQNATEAHDERADGPAWFIGNQDGCRHMVPRMCARVGAASETVYDGPLETL